MCVCVCVCVCMCVCTHVCVHGQLLHTFARWGLPLKNALRFSWLLGTNSENDKLF